MNKKIKTIWLCSKCDDGEPGWKPCKLEVTGELLATGPVACPFAPDDNEPEWEEQGER